ncbi:MAG: glucose-methanol-choline oxidoreductase [Rhodospirillaceae bacterium]|nr:glucose-methanol-choline oxidoreductase [Rhodospirillaceae bacterium]
MKTLPERCDYLIVGSGAAGAIVAARLSEDLDASVILLEAGGKNNSLLLRVPGLGFAAANHPKYNWGFEAEPSPAMDNRKLIWLQGRVLGGSSSINGMIYTRGHSREYDIWRQMGCEGWGSNDVLPYFKRLESFEDSNSRELGKEGPVSIRKAKPDLEICDAFLQAARDEGYPILSDMNSDVTEGFGFYDINAGTGRRMSAATSYLEPISKRRNLMVIPHAQVVKILIENNSANGVEFFWKGKFRQLFAGKEVVLSSGAIKTPQLLMLSGIGPENELEKFGIKVKLNSPKVGKTLQNHVCYRPQYLCSAPISSSKHLQPLNILKAGMKYVFDKSGPLAETYAVAGGFLKTDKTLEVPDAQVVLLSALGPTKTGGAGYKIRDLLPDEHGFGLTVYQGSPRSRGSVTLRSPDPFDQPLITSGYFSDPYDMEVLKTAVKKMRKMMKQPAISQFIKKELAPGEDIEDEKSLEKEIRRNGATAYHQCASCAMGPEDDSVLNEKLQVRGIDKLRIADASVMPRIPNAALHAPSMMIGEKAAALIKGEFI